MPKLPGDAEAEKGMNYYQTGRNNIPLEQGNQTSSMTFKSIGSLDDLKPVLESRFTSFNT